MLGRWNTLAPACTTRGPWASSRPGSVPMRPAPAIWSGCAGPPASSVPPVVTPGASAATPDSRGSPHRYGTRPGTRPRTPGSARRREGVPPPQHSPVKWIPPSQLMGARVDRLIVVEMATSCCVRATITDAFSYDLNLVVPVECVADRDPAAHEANLRDIGSKYATLCNTDELIAELTSPFALHTN